MTRRKQKKNQSDITVTHKSTKNTTTKNARRAHTHAKDFIYRAPKKNTRHGNEVPTAKILRIPYKDHVTDEEVRDKIQQAIGPHEELLTTVKRRKLQWYGHVSRSSGPAKTVLQGTAKGGRRQGKQRKRWEDNIREWTGLEFAKSQRAVETRGKWRKLVTKSSVMPQRPLRLRDR